MGACDVVPKFNNAQSFSKLVAVDEGEHELAVSMQYMVLPHPLPAKSSHVKFTVWSDGVQTELEFSDVEGAIQSMLNCLEVSAPALPELSIALA